MLPELKDVSIIQPNRITNAHYHYNLTQEKIFTLVMFQIQDHIRAIASGRVFEQLDLFQTGSDNITITVPLNMLSAANNYQKVRKSAEEMIAIKLHYADKEKGQRSVAGLFAKVTSPDSVNRGTLYITMLREVCKVLMKLEMKYDHYQNRDMPQQYTTYKLAVVYQCKNKYTPRLYRFISSWKGKQHIPPMSIDKFRAWLNLNEKQYINYADLKKRVLDPVNEELKKYGDCWFNVGTVKDGKKVTDLNFYVITPKDLEYRQKQMSFAQTYVKDLFRFNSEFMQTLSWIFEDTSGNINADDIIWKANQIREVQATRRDIGDSRKHAHKSLTNAFLPFKPAPMV